MTRSTRCTAIVLALLATALTRVPAAQAAWSVNPFLTTSPIAPVGGGNPQRFPASVADGNGGVFVAWQDARSGSAWNIVMQHVLANGSSDPSWPASGVVVAPSLDNQTAPKIIADGAGGAIVAWSDAPGGLNMDVYVQRVTAAGGIAPGWPANGVGVAVSPVAETNPSICTDGGGGVIVVYEYAFSSADHDIYEARVTATGHLVDWSPIYTTTSYSQNPVVAPDLAHGCYLAFSDTPSSGVVQVRAAHLDSTGSAIYTPTVLTGISPYQQYSPQIDVDGAGGAFVAWSDRGTGDFDIMLSRVGPTQAPELPFVGNGVRVCGVAGSDQDLSGIAYDGAGGVLVTWADYRYSSLTPQAFGMRVLANTAFAPGWTLNGVALGYTGLYQFYAVPVPDGTGGGLFVWFDARGGSFAGALYATRLTATGALAPNWSPAGTPFVSTDIEQPAFVASPDARRGVIAALVDYRTPGNQWLVYAARIDRYAALGDAQPVFASAKDVPADQGGHVKLIWDASYLDSDPSLAIGSYWIWRSTPATVAERAVRSGAAWADAPGAAAATPQPGRTFRHPQAAAANYAWEYVATQPAEAFAQYSYVALTTTDSMANHDPYTAFMIEAHASGGTAFWDSDPDSGHSVDNLPPAEPSPFTGTYLAGAAHLHWGQNLEPDLAGYRLYAGSSSGFVPGPGNLVVAEADTGFVVAEGPEVFYKLSAVDIHGNESVYALLGPATILAVGTGAAPRELSLAPPHPNPAGVQAGIAFTLPAAASVSVAVYDMAGRRLRALTSGPLAAGAYDLPFDLRDDRGARIASGLYFVRLTAGARTLVRRLAIVE